MGGQWGREGRLVCRFDFSLPSAGEDLVGGYRVLVDILSCVVSGCGASHRSTSLYCILLLIVNAGSIFIGWILRMLD